VRAHIIRGFIGSMAVAGASLFLTRLPRPNRIRALDLFVDVRAAHLTVLVGLTLALVGLSLLTVSWWGVRRHIVGRQDGCTRARWAAAAWSVPVLLAPPVFSGDGWSYVATGFLTSRGYSPYVWTPSILPDPLSSGVSPRWLHTVSPYGPLPLLWGDLVGRLTANPWVLLYAYRGLALIGLALLAWAVPRLARRAGRDPAAASWLVLTSPFMIAIGVGGLHVDLLMAGLMLTALAVTSRQHWVLGAVLAGAAAAVKVPGGLVAVGVVLLSLAAGAGLWQRVRRSAGVAVVGGVTLLGLGWVIGVGTGWVNALSVPARTHTILSAPTQVGVELVRLLRIHVLDGVSIVHLSQVGGVVLVALVAAFALLRPTPEDDATKLMLTAGVLVTAMVLSPLVHYWYALWCLPLLGCLALPRGQIRTVAVATGLLGAIAWADPTIRMPTLVNWVQILLGVAVPVVAVAVALRSPKEEARQTQMSE
jgi:hypothetical protein